MLFKILGWAVGNTQSLTEAQQEQCPLCTATSSLQPYMGTGTDVGLHSSPTTQLDCFVALAALIFVSYLHVEQCLLPKLHAHPIHVEASSRLSVCLCVRQLAVCCSTQPAVLRQLILCRGERQISAPTAGAQRAAEDAASHSAVPKANTVSLMPTAHSITAWRVGSTPRFLALFSSAQPHIWCCSTVCF